MNRSEVLSLLQISRGVKIAQVVFHAQSYHEDEEDTAGRARSRKLTQAQETNRAGPLYAYKIPPGLTLFVGDRVLVHVHEREMAVATVRAIHDGLPPGLDLDKITLKWIIDKIDFGWIEAMVDEEENALAQIQRAELNARLRALKNELGFDPALISMPRLGVDAIDHEPEAEAKE